MSACRGSVAFWVTCVCRHGRRQPIKTQDWIPSQAVDWQWVHQRRTLSRASWALGPPNTLRYRNIKQPSLSHLFSYTAKAQRGASEEGEWDESLSVCVMVQQGESNSLHTLLEIPLSQYVKLGDVFNLGSQRSSELFLPMTMVDGRREDDISVESCLSRGVAGAEREHGCFRSLFEAERCPAPFMNGSQFYCFHCPGTEPASEMHYRKEAGLDQSSEDLHVLLSSYLCSHGQQGSAVHTEGDGEREEQMALMYERLRIELPAFFMKSHDYTMYSNDVEFINGLLNTKTRGRVIYQLTLSMWRLVGLCCCAEARLEVLKLTKHLEDGTIRARWSFRCLPFHSLLLHFYQKDKSHLYRMYDAFSTFYIGKDGLICCHKVEKTMPAEPPLRLPKITTLVAGALVALGVKEHRPALNLLPSLLSSLRQIRT